MELARFIRSHVQRIVAEWVDFASTLRPFDRSTDPVTLQDAVVAMLSEIADDLPKVSGYWASELAVMKRIFVN